jgi:hypothetical protein
MPNEKPQILIPKPEQIAQRLREIADEAAVLRRLLRVAVRARDLDQSRVASIEEREAHHA